MDLISLLQELVYLPAPPGQEEAVRSYLANQVESLGISASVDAKGNLIVPLGRADRPKVVVTAHMDEVAMIVRGFQEDGSLAVGPLGGLYPWKLGEGPVSILASKGAIDGVLSFGCIHTEDPSSAIAQARETPLRWDMARIITGLSTADLRQTGVRTGTRVVLPKSRRRLLRLGGLISGPFLDDRADLVSWMLALEELKSLDAGVAFVATASEEVGGEGALYYLHEYRPEVCIALELGPNVPDAPVEINDQPTVWATDPVSTMLAADADLVASVGQELGMNLQFQALSRGGSDASCAAGKGLCARPITLGLPMENSHGFEIMHPGAMENLAKLTAALVKRLAG